VRVEDTPPPPPVRADEPVFDESSHTSLWFDDFSSYESVNGSGVSMTRGKGDHRWRYTPRTGLMTVTNSGGVNGGGYITAHYARSDQNAELRPVAPPDGNASYQQLVMSTWLRNRGDFYFGKILFRKAQETDAVRFGFVWTNAVPVPSETVRAGYWQVDWPYDALDPANTPEIGQDDQHLTINRDGATANFPSGGSQHWYAPNRGRAGLAGPTGSDQDTWNDGNWHRFTVRITKESGVVAGDNSDGRLEAWWDGVKVMEWIGDDPSRPEYGAVPMPGQAERIFDNLYFSGPSAPAAKWPTGNTANVDYGPTRFYTPK
jgi:hypothetical protein